MANLLTEEISSPIMIGDYFPNFRGRHPSIRVHRVNGLVVLASDSFFSPWLTYYIGQQKEGITYWLTEEQYTKGLSPSVAIFENDGTIYVVEAHNTHFPKFRSCHYCVWKFDSTDNKLKGIKKGRPLSDNSDPKICANNEGWVVAVHAGRYGISVGKVQFHSDKLPIDWLQSDRLDGETPDISICERTVGLLVKKEFFICRIGQLNDDKAIEWGQEIELQSNSGIYPSISLNGMGRVLLCYQASSLKREIIVLVGTITENTIAWDSYKYGTTGQIKGEYPSVEFTGDGSRFFIACKVSFGTRILIYPGFLPSITGQEHHTEEDLQPNSQEE